MKRTPDVGQVWQLFTIAGCFLFEITSIGYREKTYGSYPKGSQKRIAFMKSISEEYPHVADRDPWEFVDVLLNSENWTYVSDSVIANIET